VWYGVEVVFAFKSVTFSRDIGKGEYGLKRNLERVRKVRKITTMRF